VIVTQHKQEKDTVCKKYTATVTEVVQLVGII